MAYPYYTGQQPVAQPVTPPVVYGYPQPPQGQLEQLRAAQVYQAQAAAAAAAQAPQAPGTSIQWVQGEAGAKAYLIAPGASVLLMDSEGQSFYIKAADGSGMPLPLRIFDYTERTAQVQNAPQAATAAPQTAALSQVDYATRGELEALRARLDELERLKATVAEEPTIEKVEKGGAQHGKRTVSAAQ